MTAGVVTVGRHRYAVGLYWENSPGKGRVAQIAREAAQQAGQQADFFVVRAGSKDGRVPQFGLCTGEAGQDAGMPVLAACLASQIPGSWIGAFRLNEGVVLVIVRDDLIVPDGDLFFLDESEARDRLIQEIGFGGLQGIYAPEAWSIPGADTIPLTLLLNDNADVKLQRVSMSANAKLGLLGGVAALVLFVGGYMFMQSEDAVDMPQIPAAPVGLPTFGQQPMPEPKYVRFWEDAPPAMDVINACHNGLSLIPSAQAGWTMLSVTCSGLNINVSWIRESGETQPPAGANVDITGKNASQSVSLSPLSKRGEESLWDINDITNRYLLQDWPGSLTRAPDDPLPPPPPEYTGPWNPPPAPWVKRSFTLRVQNLPGRLPTYFENVPGVIVSTVNAASGSNLTEWTIEGVIYENR